MLADLTGQQLDTYHLVRRLGSGTFGGSGQKRGRAFFNTLEPLAYRKPKQCIPSSPQTCTVLSKLPEAIRRPSGDQGTASTALECPRWV